MLLVLEDEQARAGRRRDHQAARGQVAALAVVEEGVLGDQAQVAEIVAALAAVALLLEDGGAQADGARLWPEALSGASFWQASLHAS